MNITFDVLAIDPGPTRTAAVVLRRSTKGGLTNLETAPLVECFDTYDNDAFIRYLRNHSTHRAGIKELSHTECVAIEMVACYGMPVGAEVFETCVMIGRIKEAIESQGLRHKLMLITRPSVKLALCGTTRGVNDAVIRQRLIDLFGPGKAKAIGLKHAPGALYGLKGDCWAALAVGVAAQHLIATNMDTNERKETQ